MLYCPIAPCRNALGKTLDLRNRNHEPSAPLANIRELCRDLVAQIPRKYQNVVGTDFANRIRMANRDLGAGEILPLIVRASVDGEVEEIRANPAVVQQGVSFARRSVADDAFAGPLRFDLELEQIALWLLDLHREGTVVIMRE